MIFNYLLTKLLFLIDFFGKICTKKDIAFCTLNYNNEFFK